MPLKGDCLYLPETLNSLDLTLKSSKIGLNIVDDGMSYFAKELVRSFSRSHIVTVTKNFGTGLVDALNTGIKVCDSEYIARMDGDDIALPNRFAFQLECLSRNKNLVALGGQAIGINERGEFIKKIAFPIGRENVKKELSRRNSIGHPCAMFRSSAVKEIGGYRKFYETAEDYDLFLRLSEIGDLDNLEIPLIEYRIHPTQISNTKSELQYLASCASLVAFNNRRMSQTELSDRYKSVFLWHGEILRLNVEKAYRLSFSNRLEFKIQQMVRDERSVLRMLYLIFLLLIDPSRFMHIGRNKFGQAIRVAKTLAVFKFGPLS